MTDPVRMAERLALTWNAAYSRGVPEPYRTTRRAELVSDLFEHTKWDADAGVPSTQTAIVVLRRVASGALADLSWRSDARRTTSPGTRRSSTGRIPLVLTNAFQLIGIALLVVLGLFIGANGVGVLLDHSDDPWAYWYGGGQVVSSLLMLGGLAAQRRYVTAGAVAVAAGMFLVTVMLYWMLPITLPLAAICGAALVLRSRELRGTSTERAATV